MTFRVPTQDDLHQWLGDVMAESPSATRDDAAAILRHAMGQRMASARTCDNCGARMSPRWPRQRVGEEMWCPSCVQNTGTRYAGLEDAENIIDWEKRYPERLVPVSDRKVTQPKAHPRRPFMNNPGRWPYRQELTEHEHIEPFEPVPFEQRQNGMPMHTNSSSRFAVRHGIGTLAVTASAEQGVAYFLAADKPHIVRLAHDSGSTEIIYHCFSGDTRYLTREGVKTLAETVGTVQQVMTSADPSNPHSGQWVDAVIHEFGVQRLWRVTLKRNKVTKVIRATADHRWLTTNGPTRQQHRIVSTCDLRVGSRLPSLRLPTCTVSPSHDGIRMGFVFGDGAIQHQDARTYGLVTLWGNKRDLSKYFDEIATRAYEVSTIRGIAGLRYSSGMAGYTKELPPLSAPLDYLRGWLMGYFAADGSTSGTNINMTCVSLEVLQHVRDIATLLGIGTYTPTTKMRKGFGEQWSALHTVGFSAKDLDSAFFLRDDQRNSFDAHSHERERFGWTVASVEQTDVEETVYCPRVPGTETFVLEDNIWTGQCPFCGSGQVIARSDGTVECEFCKAAFTVQVQPEFSAFPQTIDGQPVDIPGMGGTSDNPDVPEDGQDPDEAAAGPTTPPGGTEEQPPEEGEDDASEDEPVDSGGNPLFNKKSYRTGSGAVLDEHAYIRHLALGVTPHRGRVLAYMLKEGHSA